VSFRERYARDTAGTYVPRKENASQGRVPLLRGGSGRLDHPLTRTVDAATERKYPVLLEYAEASFERIKQ